MVSLNESGPAVSVTEVWAHTVVSGQVISNMAVASAVWSNVRRSTLTVPVYRSVHAPGPTMSYVDPWSTEQLVTRASTSSATRQVMPPPAPGAECGAGAGGSSRCSAGGAGSGAPVATGSRSAEASPLIRSVTGAGGATVL